MAENEAQLVEPLQQAGSRETVDGKWGLQTAELQLLLHQVHGHLRFRISPERLDQGTVPGFIEFDGEHAILQRILLEDIGEGSRDQDTKAEVSNRPYSMFTRAAASEIGAGDQNLPLPGIRHIHDFRGLEIRKQEVAESFLVDALEEASRDDLVRVDIPCGEARHP